MTWGLSGAPYPHRDLLQASPSGLLIMPLVLNKLDKRQES